MALVGGLLIGALMLSSCSLINPYNIDLREKRPPKSGNRSVELEEAVKYANDVKDSYREALGEQAKFTSVLGALLVPTGAMALTMGIAKVHSNTILMTGGSGTALFGVGKWLESKPRQAAYVAGYEAVNCAVELVLPFRITERYLKPFNESMRQIAANIQEVQSQIEEVEGAKSDLSSHIDASDWQLSTAREEIRAAKSLVASAADARNKGIAVAIQRSRSGDALVSAVDGIIGQVDSAIQKSQLDLGALSTIIGGFSQSYSQFTMVPDHLRPKKVKKDETERDEDCPIPKKREELKTALSALKTGVEQLLTNKRQISDVVNHLAAENPLPTFEKCGVDPAKITADITINPAGDVVFTEGRGDQATRWILGGKKPFGVVSARSITGLQIAQPIVFGRAITITAEESLKAGTHTVQVVDGNEHTAYFNIVVEKDDSQGRPPKSETSTDTSAAQSDSAFSKLSDGVKKAVQVALCVEPDGIWGPRTEAAFEAWEKESQGEIADNVLSAAEADELKVEGEDLLERYGSKEKALKRCEPAEEGNEQT